MHLRTRKSRYPHPAHLLRRDCLSGVADQSSSRPCQLGLGVNARQFESGAGIAPATQPVRPAIAWPMVTTTTRPNSKHANEMRVIVCAERLCATLGCSSTLPPCHLRSSSSRMSLMRERMEGKKPVQEKKRIDTHAERTLTGKTSFCQPHASGNRPGEPAGQRSGE